MPSDLSKQHDAKVVWAKLTQRRWLCEEEGDRKILVSLEAANGPEDEAVTAAYEPGDHAAVFPVNSDEDVALVMKHLNGLPKPEGRRVVLQENKRNLGNSFAPTHRVTILFLDIWYGTVWTDISMGLLFECS